MKGGYAEWAGPTCMYGGLKFGREFLGARSASPKPGHLEQGSSARKISPHNFWLQKPVGNELVEETSGVPSNFPSHMDVYSFPLGFSTRVAA